jgi:hypothetical protein
MDSQVKRVRDNRRAGGGGCHRRRRGLREAQDCGCCGALVKKIGVIRATFLTSACQESKMTKEGEYQARGVMVSGCRVVPTNVEQALWQ